MAVEVTLPTLHIRHNRVENPRAALVGQPFAEPLSERAENEY
jgi:hypothetical protein